MAFFAKITQIRSCTVKFHGLHLGMVILVRNSRKTIPEMGCFNRPKCSFLLAGSGSMFSCSSLVKRQPEWSKSQFVIVPNCVHEMRWGSVITCQCLAMYVHLTQVTAPKYQHHPFKFELFTVSLTSKSCVFPVFSWSPCRLAKHKSVRSL